MQPRFKKKVISMKAYEYSVFLLSRQLQTAGQITQKLLKKGYHKTEISEAISRLTEMGYINDTQFVQIYFENLKKYKSFGYYGLKKKLIERKLDSQLIETILKGLSKEEELMIAQKFLEKQKQVKTHEQLVRMLQSRGFRGDVIGKVVKRAALEDPEEFIE